VTLSSFYLNVHDVTAAEYARCVNAGVCKEPHSIADEQAFYNWNNPGRENHPINRGWIGTTRTLTANGGRSGCRRRPSLNTLCGAGVRANLYPWGNSITPPQGYGNYADESLHRYLADWPYFFSGYDDGFVARRRYAGFTRNPFGLCDISGNVFVWVADRYDVNYFATSPSNNPPGPSSGISRMMRGCGWHYGPGFTRASYRDSGPPGAWESFLGFRCARD